jgi:hypothetical protein
VWIRRGIGIILCLVGALWIAQGSGTMHGSMMTGHSQYTALGVVVVVAGLVLIGLSLRGRGGRFR